jgi:CDP-glycerol glycerophosphotransferase (TagB/SpsB family)
MMIWASSTLARARVRINGPLKRTWISRFFPQAANVEGSIAPDSWALAGARVRINEQLKRNWTARSLIRAVYAVVRLIVPSRSRQIGFISSPDITDNSLALFERIVASGRAQSFRLIWLVADVQASREALQRDFSEADLKNVSVLGRNSIRGIWAFLRCRSVFSTHGIYWFARQGFHQTIFNLWHGMPIKTIGALDGKQPADLSLTHFTVATSEFFADLMAQSFYLPRNRVLVTGLPRNEWLFQREERYVLLKEGRANLVLWLPTFRTSHRGEIRSDSDHDALDPLSAETLAALDAALDGARSLLVVKLHAMDIKNTQDWPSYKNIRIFSDERFRAEGLNLYKLLACSDALVTDFSSVAIDYLLLQKPIGLYSPDRSEYGRGFMPSVLEKVEARSYMLNSVDEFGVFLRKLPPARRAAPEEAEDLYRPDLRTPSQAILSAAGLADII